MKDKLDQHIDQKVRESYEAQQHTAPERVWEQLQQELGDHTDALLDEKLRDGFDQLPPATAPMVLWTAIADELPAAPVTDGQLDQKVKESYQEQQLVPPSKVWDAINRQLNIDKTWQRIEAALDTRMLWAKRMLLGLQAIAALAFVLLLVRTCGSDSSLPEPLAYSKGYKKPSKEMALTTNGEPKHGATSNQNSAPSAAPTQDLPSFLKRPQDLQEAINEAHQALTMLTTPPSVGIADRETESVQTIIKEQPASRKNTGQGPAQKDDLDATVPMLKSNQALTETLNTPEKEDATAPSTAEDKEPAIAPDPVADKTILALALPSTQPVGHIKPLGALEFTNESTPKVAKWGVGVFLALNSTALLNNKTQTGFDYNSLTINYFGVAANYGIWGRYRFNTRHALQAEYSINADHRQAYGVYEKADFRVKEWVMKYTRLGLSYEWTAFTSKRPNRFKNRLVGQVGIYGGYLRSVRLLDDGKTVYDRVGEYQDFDAGLKLVLGHELTFDNVVFGYGLRSDIGLTNISKGSPSKGKGSQDSRTNLFHFGGYITLGYQF